VGREEGENGEKGEVRRGLEGEKRRWREREGERMSK